ALEHGVEGVTVDAIAAAAGVSARTFHNYFPGKEEAIVAPLTDATRSLLAGLAGRPADEPVWDSVRAVLHEVIAPPERFEETVALMRIVKTDPSLVASQLCGLGEMQRDAAAVIAARTGTDAARDLYPHLVAGVIGLTMRVVVNLWVDGGGRADLRDLVDSALAQFRTGLPVPGQPAPDQPDQPDLPAHDSPAPDLPAPEMSAPDLPATGPAPGPVPDGPDREAVAAAASADPSG
ncbi:TetR family transcriptional regulator, partial [Spirillospora sp. NPDC049652]